MVYVMTPQHHTEWSDTPKSPLCHTPSVLKEEVPGDPPTSIDGSPDAPYLGLLEFKIFANVMDREGSRNYSFTVHFLAIG
jgi:hypothetical protein